MNFFKQGILQLVLTIVMFGLCVLYFFFRYPGMPLHWVFLPITFPWTYFFIFLIYTFLFFVNWKMLRMDHLKFSAIVYSLQVILIFSFFFDKYRFYNNRFFYGESITSKSLVMTYDSIVFNVELLILVIIIGMIFVKAWIVQAKGIELEKDANVSNK